MSVIIKLLNLYLNISQKKVFKQKKKESFESVAEQNSGIFDDLPGDCLVRWKYHHQKLIMIQIIKLPFYYIYIYIISGKNLKEKNKVLDRWQK